MKKPDVFDYLNYREYLKDYYTFRKSTEPTFSYRSFGTEVGLKTKSFLKMVIDGKKMLSEKLRKNVASVCKMTSEETRYFFKLIDFTHEKNVAKQTEYFKELHKLARRVSTKDMVGGFNKMVSKWYYLAIKSLISSIDFKPSPKYISKRFRHLISPGEAKEAIEVLKELGVIKEESKKYIVTDQHLSTNEETINSHMKSFHEQMLNLGSIALELIPPKEREFLAVTMDISKDRIGFINEKIKKFHQDLLYYIDSDEKSEDVCQLNIQFFKLSKEEL